MMRNKRFFYVVLSLLMACFLLSGYAVRGPQTGDIKEDFQRSTALTIMKVAMLA